MPGSMTDGASQDAPAEKTVPCCSFCGASPEADTASPVTAVLTDPTSTHAVCFDCATSFIERVVAMVQEVRGGLRPDGATLN